jgi:hypothetical protein
MVDWDTGTQDEPDYELQSGASQAPELPPDRSALILWAVIAALVVGTAIAAYIAFGGGKGSVKVVTEPVPIEAPPADRPLGGDAESIVLPALDETDPIVRQLVGKITSHPRLAAWLATDGLIRKFVAGVSGVAEGKTATAELRVLRPQSAFVVADRRGALYIDPRSYDRYNALADAAASIDPAGAAKVYATLKPRIEQAYRELGIEDRSFDRPLQQALVELLKTPIVDGPVQVEPQGASAYRFASSDLEALTAAQKQLLRTGPANTRKIQASLRAIAQALGVPAERLPRVQ